MNAYGMCIKFGFCNHFQKSDFNTHMIGNMNNGNLKPLMTFTHYLTEKVVSGNSSVYPYSIMQTIPLLLSVLNILKVKMILLNKNQLLITRFKI
jgi:hypothetical protein